MKNRKHFFLILFFLGSGLFISCKKDHGTAKDNPGISLPGTGNKIYIPDRLVTGKSNMSFSYTGANALSRIDYGNGDSTVLKFNTAGKPTSFTRYKAHEVVSVSYYNLDKDGTITGADQFAALSAGGDSLYTGAYSITYNTDGKITKVVYLNKMGKTVSEQQYSYGETGNLNGQKSTVPALTVDYLYDTSNALFRNVNYVWLFALEKESPLFLSAINNIKDCTYPSKAESNQASSYAYNEDGFPKTITTTASGLTSTSKVTYK